MRWEIVEEKEGVGHHGGKGGGGRSWRKRKGLEIVEEEEGVRDPGGRGGLEIMEEEEGIGDCRRRVGD